MKLRGSGAALAGVAGLIAMLTGCSGRSSAPSPPDEPAPEVPVEPVADSRPIELCAAGESTCALLRDGRVACWGDNHRHQVSADDRAVVHEPALAGLPPSVALYCGALETCARTAGGELHCIGGSTGGAERVELDASIIDAALVYLGGCVLDDAGAVRCWTRDERSRSESLREAGVRGIGLVTHPTDREGVCVVQERGPARCIQLPTLGETGTIALPSAAPSERCASGTDHTCCIEGERVRCRGDDSRGPLGGGPPRRGGPVEVPGLSDVIAIDAEHTQVCALTTSGEVACWGSWVLPRRGPPPPLGRQFSAAEGPPVSAPRRMGVPAGVLEIRAGGRRPTCARNPAGWWCLYDHWRRDPSVGGTRPGWLPRVSRAATRHIARDGVCGVRRDGRVVCATGLGLATERMFYRDEALIEHDEPFVEVASALALPGARGVCARTEAGTVRCFRVAENEPPRMLESPGIAALAGAVQVDAASWDDGGVACAVTAEGAVYCWGGNRYGQLGPDRPPHDALTSPELALDPTRIEGLPPVTRVAVGGAYVCALATTRRVHCWGDGTHGAVPEASTDSAVWVDVAWPPRER